MMVQPRIWSVLMERREQSREIGAAQLTGSGHCMGRRDPERIGFRLRWKVDLREETWDDE